MSNNDKVGRFIFGLLVGGLVGSVVALLYAPKSGKDLRKDISDKADDFVGDVEDIYLKGKEKAEKIIEDGKRKASDVIKDAKKLVSSN